MTGSRIKAPLTQFIGRSQLLDQVEALVRAERLVTLVGPGGIGKTRLSLELARRLADEYADGVCVVALDAVQNPDDVPWRVAAALHASDQSSRTATEHVIRHLEGKEMLVVVDNCEHLLDAAGELISAILATCPEVRVLTTSLGPLGLTGEHVVAVPPLTIPEDSASLTEVAGSEAVGLLIQRAAQAGVPLAITKDNCEDVVELCRRLDGMPLAIELAAVRLRSLSVADILRRLDERFSLLRGSRDAVGRHRTLSALVDWSYDLCTPEERLLWTRLSVFLDGCDLAAAESVCGFGALQPQFVIDLLDHLVAKSIVQADPCSGTMRYRMLVTMREYGGRLAQRAGEWEELHRRHRDVYLERARTMVQQWPGPRQASSMAQMRVERANIVGALEWSLSLPQEQPRAAELAALLRYQWVSGRYLSDGRYRLERTLATPEVTGRVRGEALWVLTWVALIQGDHADGERYLIELRALAEQLGDPMLRAQANHWDGLLHLFRGRTEEAAGLYEAAISTFRMVGDIAAWQTALFQYGLCLLYSGRTDAALASQSELIALSENNGEAWCKAYAYWVRGLILYHTGDLAQARASARSALTIQQEFEDGICVAHTLLLLAGIALTAGDVGRAAGCYGAAGALWQSMGTRIESFGPGMAQDAAVTGTALRGALGEEEWLRLREVPARPLGELVVWALHEAAELDLEPAPAALEPLPGVRLTEREAQVAACLTRGLSNRDIATALTISVRTAEGHVEQVRKKLGAATRAQAAAILLRGRS